MSVELRLPSITGTTEAEQLSQIRSYLYQFVPQLQWALSSLESSSTSAIETAQKTVVQKTTSSPASPESTFNAIKSLIIKSADIVQAYYDEISERLEGLYVAESDFGTYTEQTAQEITKTSKNVDLLFANTGTIQTTIDSVNDDFYSTNARIRVGYLYDDDKGNPVYGLEIGQKNEGTDELDAFARLASDKLEFYDKGTRVAWISGYKLNITHADISGSLTLGRYVIDSSNGLTLKWV